MDFPWVEGLSLLDRRAVPDHDNMTKMAASGLLLLPCVLQDVRCSTERIRIQTVLEMATFRNLSAFLVHK